MSTAFKPLGAWLFIVGLTAFFATFNGYAKLQVIRDNQFSLAASQVTPLCGRMFGAWTLVAGAVRLRCALSLYSRPLYEAAMFTFAVAFGVYAYEGFVAHTIPLDQPATLAPFVVSTLSLVWMVASYAHYAAGGGEQQKKQKKR